MIEKRRATQQQKSAANSKTNPNLSQIKEDIQFNDNDEPLERQHNSQ